MAATETALPTAWARWRRCTLARAGRAGLQEAHGGEARRVGAAAAGSGSDGGAPAVASAAKRRAQSTSVVAVSTMAAR